MTRRKLSSESPLELYEARFAMRRQSQGLHVSFTPPKLAIYEFFNERISKSAIKRWDDQWCVIGKTCIINLEPRGVIDIWICNPEDMFSGLGQKSRQKSPESIQKSQHERRGGIRR